MVHNAVAGQGVLDEWGLHRATAAECLISFAVHNLAWLALCHHVSCGSRHVLSCRDSFLSGEVARLYLFLRPQKFQVPTFH